jgi:hypothetical protein
MLAVTWSRRAFHVVDLPLERMTMNSAQSMEYVFGTLAYALYPQGVRPRGRKVWPRFGQQQGAQFAGDNDRN